MQLVVDTPASAKMSWHDPECNRDGSLWGRAADGRDFVKRPDGTRILAADTK